MDSICDFGCKMKHKPKINNSDLFELSVCIRFEKNGEFFFILRAEE